MDAEYEILPHKLLQDLKYDVEALKKKLNEPETKTNELILEIESLKDSIHDLTSLFQKVLDETKTDDPAIMLGKIVSQNEIIATGMVAISDKLEDWMKKQNKPEHKSIQVQHTMGIPPPMRSVAPMATPDFPPPPPGMGKRRGVFK